MDEILAELNTTLIDIRLVSEDTRKAVNDTFKSGVQEIEFLKYAMEVKNQARFQQRMRITLVLKC